MHKRRMYYQAVLCGKRCEHIKDGNLFFRSWSAEIEDMKKDSVSSDECLHKGMQWLKDLADLELSAEGFEWSLLQSGYREVGTLFDWLNRPEDKLFCECKEYECGVGLLRFYRREKDIRKAMGEQLILGRKLTKNFQKKEDWDQALYYTDVNMDYLLSAKGRISAEVIDDLFKLVIEDRQEICEKIKK